MRIAFHIAIIASILFMPWWITAMLVAAAAVLLEHFYEALIYGIAVDALYGTSFGLRGFPYAASAYSLIVFTTSYFVRRRLMW